MNMLRASSAGETAPSQERVCINIIRTRSPRVRGTDFKLQQSNYPDFSVAGIVMLNESMYSADVYVSYRVSRKSKSIALEIGNPKQEKIID